MAKTLLVLLHKFLSDEYFRTHLTVLGSPVTRNYITLHWTLIGELMRDEFFDIS